MAASADIAPVKRLTTQPAGISDGAPVLLRGVHRLAGVSLALAAVGIWVAPGATWDTDVMLFKLALSSAALVAGFGLIQAGVRPVQPEIQIDTIRREIRVVRTQAKGPSEVTNRCAFAQLSRVERTGNHVRMYGPDDALIADVTLTQRAALNSLIAGLQDAGKLS